MPEIQVKQDGELLKLTINGQTRNMTLAIATKTPEGLRVSFAVDVLPTNADPGARPLLGYAEVFGKRGETFTHVKTGRKSAPLPVGSEGEPVGFKVVGWPGQTPA